SVGGNGSRSRASAAVCSSVRVLIVRGPSWCGGCSRGCCRGRGPGGGRGRSGCGGRGGRSCGTGPRRSAVAAPARGRTSTGRRACGSRRGVARGGPHGSTGGSRYGRSSGGLLRAEVPGQDQQQRGSLDAGGLHGLLGGRDGRGERHVRQVPVTVSGHDGGGEQGQGAGADGGGGNPLGDGRGVHRASP